MSTISRLLPSFNRLSVQPSTLRLARSYVTKAKILPATTKASSSVKKTTPEKKTPGKKVASGKENSAKTGKKPVDVKNSGKAAATKPKPKPKRLETVLTKMPTSGRSPWALYIQANKQQYHDTPREPGKKFNIADVTTELAKQWKEMPEAQKKVFNDLAAEDKIRSQTERAKLLASASANDFRTENSLRRAEGKVTIKDPSAPKKPKNPFMFFSIAERQKGVNGTITDFQKALGESWRTMSESQKEPYAKQAEADRARYAKEIKIYDPDRFLPKTPKTPKAEKAGKAEKAEKAEKAVN
jgi:hypothetical protein